MKFLRPVILFGTLLVFLYMVNSGIINAENNIKTQPRAYFELGTRDPQSLIQGFYMTLNYQIERDATFANVANQDRGQIVLSLDENDVAKFERAYVEGESLAANEIVVNFFGRNGRVRVGVDSFLFQEGHADDFARARFAEVRILPDGGVMLINLTDENLNPIIPE